MGVGGAFESVRIRVGGKWLLLSEDVVRRHPGGAVLLQYRDSDATHMFDGFHAGSTRAFKQLEALKKTAELDTIEAEKMTKLLETKVERPADVNVSAWDVSVEEEKRLVKRFEQLRADVKAAGLLKAAPLYYTYKTAETLSLMVVAFYLQYLGWYITSACFLALCWQQLGWLTHEFCHQQPFADRRTNDAFSLFLGNVAQGFSRDWWKDKHNTHHATTNIVGQDGDIDLAPLVAFVPDHIRRKYEPPLERFLLRFIPYQHLYFTALLPLLRISWVTQSILWVLKENFSEYRVYRRNAVEEQIGILAHWAWVIYQLYALPTWPLRLIYFVISQLGAGLLIAHVVTFAHNSVDKYPPNSRILNNYAALQILTTRNMTPNAFIDWLWGGLNYQIEHHLFPTMPRSNLRASAPYVRAFCKDTGLPYQCDDYATGYAENLRQLERMSELVEKEIH